MSTLDYDVTSALVVAGNPYQGTAKRVLCVCSVGILRSATAAKVLWKELGYNTRAAGTEPYALIPVTPVLIAWAHEIVCMEIRHERKLCELTSKPLVTLGIPDNYEYMDPELWTLIVEQYADKANE